MSGAVVRVAASKMRRHGIERVVADRVVGGGAVRVEDATRAHVDRVEPVGRKDGRVAARGGRIVAKAPPPKGGAGQEEVGGLLGLYSSCDFCAARWRAGSCILCGRSPRYSAAMGARAGPCWAGVLAWRLFVRSVVRAVRCRRVGSIADFFSRDALAGCRALQPVASRRGMAWCPRRTGGRWRAV